MGETVRIKITSQIIRNFFRKLFIGICFIFFVIYQINSNPVFAAIDTAALNNLLNQMEGTDSTTTNQTTTNQNNNNTAIDTAKLNNLLNQMEGTDSTTTNQNNNNNTAIDTAKLNDILNQMENVDNTTTNPGGNNSAIDVKKLNDLLGDLENVEPPKIEVKTPIVTPKVVPTKKTAGKVVEPKKKVVIPDTKVKTGPEEVMYLGLLSAILSFILIYYNREKLF